LKFFNHSYHFGGKKNHPYFPCWATKEFRFPFNGVGVSDGNQKFLVTLKVGQGMATKIFHCHLTHLHSPMATKISIAIKGGDQNLLVAIPCPTFGVTKKI
jgi:hypothetical protein